MRPEERELEELKKEVQRVGMGSPEGGGVGRDGVVKASAVDLGPAAQGVHKRGKSESEGEGGAEVVLKMRRSESSAVL